MKKHLLLFLFVLPMAFISCDDTDDDSQFADYLVARPITISKAGFKSSVDIVAPLPVEESGKIYAYKNYIFVNDKYRGIHVLDNTDPKAPQKIAFIKIPGNVDISVKDDHLFADSLNDLVVLDISEISGIKMLNRMENVLAGNVFWPAEADIFEWQDVDYDKEIVVGWTSKTERRRIQDYEDLFLREADFALAKSAQGSTIGQGGSMARFKIVDNYLYAVDSHNINIFDISNLEYPKDLEDVHAGFDIETIFNYGQYLFLGSMRGMYIYDISNPETPTFVSEFQHGTACDPVVVDDDYAYVTLRGGNWCGATESGLFIVDISNISKPELKSQYPMDGPYGLGVKGDKLFVCDGDSGLKVYDKTDVENLNMLNHFKDVVTFDVIPLDQNLLMVGDRTLFQYEYLENEIKLMSVIEL
ncbi:hypothetical protein K8352_18520 [Flavobacteriaceae bacterium F89]|uniref:LVIVD repeat-containing protein n=1 Tax=Cerina litoralis TaxID=2874477 RepID=A0AAE3JRC2_9FLAO|nr:hypothetical protein [Cerina litoralis]MCG2462764.1 hypothetical protein [Cerina litoralis]